MLWLHFTAIQHGGRGEVACELSLCDGAFIYLFGFGSRVLHAAHGGMAVFYIFQAKATAKTKSSLRWTEMPLL